MSNSLPLDVGGPFAQPKVAVALADRIRGKIVNGAFAPGSVLPTEPVLMEQLKVSRPTLRQALRILESEGLLQVRRGQKGGPLVLTPQPDVVSRVASSYLVFEGATVAEVHDARIVIETAAVAAVADYGDPKHVERLREILVRSDAVLDRPHAARELGAEFHRALVEMSGNRALILFARMIEQILQAHLKEWQEKQDRLGIEHRTHQHNFEHVRVVDLIESGETEAAVECWREHVTALRDYYLRGTGNRTVEEFTNYE